MSTPKFTVYDDAPALALRFGTRLDNGRMRYAPCLIAVASLAEASRAWEEIRDQSGAGASEAPMVDVVDTHTGKPVARISYNGRVWDRHGQEISLSA